MQKIFTVTEGIYEYANLGRDYPFPTAPFNRCHKCGQIVHFKKHGFYERYLVCRFFNGRIIIRRYICPHCGCTISFLPDFCLPGYIHALEHIFEYTYSAFFRKGTLNSCVHTLNNKFSLSISRQLLYQYRMRILENLTLIQVGVRQFKPDIEFLREGNDKKERAKDILNIVRNWPITINSFSQQFLEKNHKTIFAPCKLL